MKIVGKLTLLLSISLIVLMGSTSIQAYTFNFHPRHITVNNQVKYPSDIQINGKFYPYPVAGHTTKNFPWLLLEKLCQAKTGICTGDIYTRYQSDTKKIDVAKLHFNLDDFTVSVTNYPKTGYHVIGYITKHNLMKIDILKG